MTRADPPDIRHPFVPIVSIGQTIGGKYEVLDIIGKGSIAFVVAAKRVALDDEVALKFLRQEYLANRELVSRFAQEARIAVSIRSEHVVRVFDVGVTDAGTPFMVMERLEGRDLGRVLEENGPVKPPAAVDYVLQACEALATAHAKGIVHRDVKPENLFLTRAVHGTDVVKVLDFGISKVALTGAVLENDPSLVRTTVPIGSPVYMSPEQVRMQPNVDARADIWGLGCVLYELMAGVPAFDAPSLMQLCTMILERDPVRLDAINPTVPEELRRVVERCLRKDPAARFQSAADLATALAPFASTQELARSYVRRCRHLLQGSAESTIHTRETVRPPASLGPPEGLSVSITPPETNAVDVLYPRFRRSWNWRLVAIGTLVVCTVAGWELFRPAVPTGASRAAAAAPTPLVAPEASSAAPEVLEAPASPVVPSGVARPDAGPSITQRPKRNRGREPARVRTHGPSGEPDVGF
jgi:serine/threonine protein kinase